VSDEGGGGVNDERGDGVNDEKRGRGVGDDDITLVGSDWGTPPDSRPPADSGPPPASRPPAASGPPDSGPPESESPRSPWAATDDYLHPGPEQLTPRRGPGTRRTRAARRRAIRRRRLVALAVLAAIVAVSVFLVVRGCGGDPFVGTWAKNGSGTVVISQGDDGRYRVAFGTQAGRPGKRNGDRLTTTRKQKGKRVTIWFTPGTQADTLEEHFPDGTTDVLTRQ